MNNRQLRHILKQNELKIKKEAAGVSATPRQGRPMTRSIVKIAAGVALFAVFVGGWLSVVRFIGAPGDTGDPPLVAQPGNSASATTTPEVTDASTVTSSVTTAPVYTLLTPSGNPQTWVIEKAGRYNEAIEEITGDLINDTIYLSCDAARRAIGADITLTLTENAYSTIQYDVMSGNSTGLVGVTAKTAAALANTGVLYDLGKETVLDAYHDFLFPGVADTTSPLWFASGFLSPNAVCRTPLVMYNKQAAQKYAIDPYAESWTLDNFIRLCRAGTRDLDGDKIYAANDAFGMIGTTTDLFTLSYCAGYESLCPDYQNIPDEDAGSYLTNRLGLFLGTKNDEIWAEMNNIWNQGRCQFRVINVGDLMDLCITSEYDNMGLLPMPRGTETSDYISSLDMEAMVYAIPQQANKDDALIAFIAKTVEMQTKMPSIKQGLLVKYPTSVEDEVSLEIALDHISIADIVAGRAK